MDGASDSTARRFVVGLGNPGRKYVRTRHNVGFRVLERLRSRWSAGEARERFDGLCWQTNVRRGEADRPVTLLAPMTYMNESGRAVRQMLTFYKARPTDMLVVMDDLALPTGQLRLRPSGSAGGHNGLEDILRALGRDDVPRLRVGIDAPPGRMDPRDYVLGKFDDNEEEIIGVAVREAADAAEDWLFRDMHEVMQRINRKD